MREDRIKEVRIDERLIVDMLNAFRNHQMITLPVTDELPEGTEVVRVMYDFDLRAFKAHVYHPSFQPVPLGAYPERVGDCFTVETLELVPLPLRGSLNCPGGQCEHLAELTSVHADKKPTYAEHVSVLINSVARGMGISPEELATRPVTPTPEVTLPEPTTEVEIAPQANKQIDSDFFFDGP